MKTGMTTLIIAIFVIVVLLLLIISVGKKIQSLKAKTRSMFGDAENLSYLLKEAKHAADTFNAEEKSLCSMTGLMLPQIRRDFPEFDWEEYRADVNSKVKDYIRETLGGERPSVHRTEIADYRKRDGGCTIDVQTSAGFTKEEKQIEKRFATQITYVQDYLKVPAGQTGEGLSCPHCGAPVKILGYKYCEYCGAGIKEINRRVWKILEIREC